MSAFDKFSSRKQLDDHDARARARQIRDDHWQIMDRMVQHGTLHITPWNKDRQDEAPDEVRFGLISGMEWLEWVDRHADWFVVGEWENGRNTRPYSLTEAGLSALAERERYDLEPVTGGLVEPGWQAIPLPAGATS